jgi:sensor histidine kinase YesM
MLYNTREKKITLAKEIEFLNSYLGIQKLRFGNSINVSFQSNISDPSYLVESMLLLPLIENAFKHGVGTVDNPSINIKLLAKNGILEFEIINSFNPDQLTIKEISGIGNKNVQKRLSYLYEDKHEFSFFTKDDTFTAKLNLILK